MSSRHKPNFPGAFQQLAPKTETGSKIDPFTALTDPSQGCHPRREPGRLESAPSDLPLLWIDLACERLEAALASMLFREFRRCTLPLQE